MTLASELLKEGVLSKRQYFVVQSVLSDCLKSLVAAYRDTQGNGGSEWSRISREASEPWEHKIKSMVKSGVLSSLAARFVHTEMKLREFLLVNPIYTEYLENPKNRNPMKQKLVCWLKKLSQKRRKTVKKH